MRVNACGQPLLVKSSCQIKQGNSQDVFSDGSGKGRDVVGHIPQKLGLSR